MPNQWTVPTATTRNLFQQQKNYLWDLCQRVGTEHDFAFDDWEILFYVLESYGPDCIFEIGRGMGNTTCVFLEHCVHHRDVKFISVDLYDNWHQETIARLPKDFPGNCFNHELLHMDFMDFDLTRIADGEWKNLLFFWDVNDVKVAKRVVNELLPQLQDKNVLVCMHDVGHKTGRPRRYHWREYESIYPDLEVVGEFLDKTGWPAAVPDTREIFGHYRNAGHCLIFQSPSAL